MKLSELIKYCQETLNKYGDHEITQVISGPGNQFKPTELEFEIINGAWVKKKTVTEHEEVTIKRRLPLYKITIREDIKGRALSIEEARNYWNNRSPDEVLHDAMEGEWK